MQIAGSLDFVMFRNFKHQVAYCCIMYIAVIQDLSVLMYVLQTVV